VRRIPAVVVAVALALAACSNDEPVAEPAADADQEPVTVEADDESQDDPVDDLDEGADGGAASAAAPSGETLVSAQHPLTEQDGHLEIELRARIVGELFRVAVTFTPRDIGDERTSVAQLFGSSGSANGISARLIDPVNLLEYETVRRAVPHGQSAPAYQDQPTTLNFYFAAPVEELDTFDFLLDFVVGAPDWPGFVDVPFEVP
jgi:hypothetical protein